MQTCLCSRPPNVFIKRGQSKDTLATDDTLSTKCRWLLGTLIISRTLPMIRTPATRSHQQVWGSIRWDFFLSPTQQNTQIPHKRLTSNHSSANRGSARTSSSTKTPRTGSSNTGKDPRTRSVGFTSSPRPHGFQGIILRNIQVARIYAIKGNISTAFSSLTALRLRFGILTNVKCRNTMNIWRPTPISALAAWTVGFHTMVTLHLTTPHIRGSRN